MAERGTGWTPSDHASLNIDFVVSSKLSTHQWVITAQPFLSHRTLSWWLWIDLLALSSKGGFRVWVLMLFRHSFLSVIAASRYSRCCRAQWNRSVSKTVTLSQALLCRRRYPRVGGTLANLAKWLYVTVVFSLEKPLQSRLVYPLIPAGSPFNNRFLGLQRQSSVPYPLFLYTPPKNSSLVVRRIRNIDNVI